MEFGANGNTTNVYEYGDGRNSATINGTKGYYLYDGRGSVAGLTGNSGGSMITYRYDAYGNTTKSNNTLNNPYQYNAEYTDSSTGLQYLRARYYDSSQGRFTTKDTLLGSTDKPITRNLYTYCGNNPLNITDPSGHGWWSNAVNSVKSAAKAAGNWANKHIVQPVKKAANTAVTWANNHIVQPIKSRITNSAAYQKGKQYVEKAKQGYNQVTNYVSNKAQQFYNDYVPPKMQKAIEEAKRFVCTTKDRIVKDAKEFIQNVDWKKVAIGVAATAAITLAVVATGGAAAPVLIGAAVGAGISTGTTVVSGVIQGKSPAEIAQDASGAFMWGAIGGAVGGGTTSLLESVGSSTAGNYVRQNLIEGGMDTAVDLAQSASNGGLTPQGVVTSVVTNMVGAFINAPDTPSTTRNQLVDGVTDNNNVKRILKDDLSDDVLKTKPKNSPNPQKWLDKGGSIDIDKNDVWTYTNASGQSVKYIDGYPDFKGAGLVKQEVDIGSFSNYSSDFKKADLLAPNGPKSSTSTWHHSTDGHTLQEIDRSVHKEFTHRGGMSLMKNS